MENLIYYEDNSLANPSISMTGVAVMCDDNGEGSHLSSETFSGVKFIAPSVFPTTITARPLCAS